MKPAIDLAGFEQKFRADPDPWDTWTDHDEAVKRAAVLHALGTGPAGRILELGSGNGSNSRALAQRALRLDACDGTGAGTALTRKALTDLPGAHAHRLVLPGRFPHPPYDAIVIAELLYYLSPRSMAAVARALAAALRPGGRLVLAHHRIAFDDAAQPPEGVHARFLSATGTGWSRTAERRTARWVAQGFVRPGRA